MPPKKKGRNARKSKRGGRGKRSNKSSSSTTSNETTPTNPSSDSAGGAPTAQPGLDGATQQKLQMLSQKLRDRMLLTGAPPPPQSAIGGGGVTAHHHHGGRTPVNATPGNKFWSSQPMLSPGETVDESEIGPYETKSLDDVRPEPYELHSEFEWCDLDLTADQDVDELYNLLMKHYVSDDQGTFRFKYTREFLRWALLVPGYRQQWHLGVRVKKNRTLCACITGIPTRVQVHDQVVEMVEINFLCVHTKLRSKRLAPVLIQEITRRVNLENIWQAVYTAGIVIPTPIARNRYFHRSLNPKKLIEVGFSRLPRRMTMPMIQRLNRVPKRPKTRGLREFTPADAEQVLALLSEELRKYKLFIHFSLEEVLHLFTPQDDVVYSYVVEDPSNEGVITDFVSFYIIPSSILRNAYHTEMRQAYCYYNAYTRTPLKELIMDALIMANNARVDVFNALDVMNNASFFDELKFHPGDGHLQYYVYNWKSPELNAGDVAVVLL